jgi:ubiquinone/menaquinone biosynthesis C-methylase UbiE
MTKDNPQHVWSDRWSDPKEIFDGLTEDYDLYRPHYADAALRQVADYAGDVAHALDLASGTGILTRALRGHLPNAVLIGAEPGQDMLAEAAAKTPPALAIDWLATRAEDVTFADDSLDLITVGQAAHWFDRPVFYDECARVLRPGGTLAILYNNRIKGTPVAEAHETTLEKLSPGYWRGYRDFDTAEELRAQAGTRDVARTCDRWSWDRTVDQFVGYIRSTSHYKVAIRERPEAEVLAILDAALRPLVEADGLLHVPYETVVTLARFD